MVWARRPRVPVLASVGLVGVAAAALVGVSLRDASAGPGSPATSTVAATAPPTSAPASASAPAGSTASTADAASVSLAAESLIAPYIESQYSLAVTDVACSTPASGAEGEQFVCYALRPGDLVVALRATIGADQVVSLALITDLSPPTTVPPTAPATSAP